jgi:hypothetical protein
MRNETVYTLQVVYPTGRTYACEFTTDLAYAEVAADYDAHASAYAAGGYRTLAMAGESVGPWVARRNAGARGTESRS